MSGTHGLSRWSRPAAILGGLFWMTYGVLEMLEPWGSATDPYRDDVGYEVVNNAPLYIVNNLPGSAALLLSSLALLGLLALLRTTGRTGRVARGLAYVALGLSAVSLVGIAARFDPLFTSGRIFGTLALGGALFVAGFGVRRAGAGSGWGAVLLTLGFLGMFLLPLWPLVYAVKLLSEAAGAAIIGLFGLGWVLLGYMLYSGQPATVGRTWLKGRLRAGFEQRS